MTKMRRSEVVKVFNENTAGQDFAKNISACVYSIFIRDFMAYTYAINEVVDRLQDDYPKLYRHEIKHICKETEKGFDTHLATTYTKYGIGYYKEKMQDLSRNYFDSLSKEIEMIRMQVMQVFTKHEETNRVILSYLYTARFIADFAQRQWSEDVGELERIFYVKRALLPADIDVKKTFGCLRLDKLAHDLKVLAEMLCDRTGDIIDLNADDNILLAKKIFFNRLQDESLIYDAFYKAGLMDETKE